MKGMLYFGGLTLLFLTAVSGPAPAQSSDLEATFCEEQGIEPEGDIRGAGGTQAELLFRTGGVLLIPESTNDTVGMYDPYDGTFLGILIDNSLGLMSTPINAVLGPDYNLYVSDQVKDSVFVFDMAGNYLSTYADASDGLNNVRGIDFFNGHLFVTSGDDYVAEFSGPHTRLADFINDGSDPFDIQFMPNGEALLCDIGNDRMSHYKADGTLKAVLFGVDFPEQMVYDDLLPGEFLVTAFSDKKVTDFELDGTVVETTNHGMSSRGVFRLGNGKLLVTSGSGVFMIEPGTGVELAQLNTGSARFIEYVDLGQPLTVDVSAISQSEGGMAHFFLNPGPECAKRLYILLGGFSGTHPGIPLPGGQVTLPVNWDLFTTIITRNFNTPMFKGFIGVFNMQGHGLAALDTLGPMPGGAGLTFSFAFTTYEPFDMVSNAVEIDIVP